MPLTKCLPSSAISLDLSCNDISQYKILLYTILLKNIGKVTKVLWPVKSKNILVTRIQELCNFAKQVVDAVTWRNWLSEALA